MNFNVALQTAYSLIYFVLWRSLQNTRCYVTIVTESFIHGTDNVAVSARDEERWKSLFTPAMKRVVDGHTWPARSNIWMWSMTSELITTNRLGHDHWPQGLHRVSRHPVHSSSGQCVDFELWKWRC